MTANLLAPQAVPDNERCRTKLEQHKQQQAQYYNRGAIGIDLDPLKRGDTVRLKLFQLGKRKGQKGIVQNQLDKRSYEVEMPYNVVHYNSVHLRLTIEPSPPLKDEIPYEISAEAPEVAHPSSAWSYKSQPCSSEEVSPPTLSQGSSEWLRSSFNCSDVTTQAVAQTIGASATSTKALK